MVVPGASDYQGAESYVQTGLNISARMQTVLVSPVAYNSQELPQDNLSHMFASPLITSGLNSWNHSPIPLSEVASGSVSSRIQATVFNPDGQKPTRSRSPEATTSRAGGKKLKRTRADFDDGEEGESIKDGGAKGG